jgi:hypothetical protein
MFAYSKLNGQWIIRGADAGAAGQTVTVTKRNGESKQVALGARVGEGFGYENPDTRKAVKGLKVNASKRPGNSAPLA